MKDKAALRGGFRAFAVKMLRVAAERYTGTFTCGQ
jgi:hypothetical protein